MTQSTSPQALIYASIDAARAQMATQGEQLWSRAVDNAEWLRARLAPLEGVRVLSDEVLGQDGVENGVGNLIRDLVRMPFRNRFGSKKMSSRICQGLPP